MIGKAFSKLVNRTVLYYPGCLTKYGMPEIQQEYEELLKKARIDYVKLADEELCCGSPAWNAGYETEFKDLIDKNIAIFKKYGIGKIITNCPACFMVLKDYATYRKDFYIEVEHITTFLLKLIEKGKIKLNKIYNDERVTYHDPCHLGRYSNIYEEPRELLKLVGFNVVTTENTMQTEYCCGGGAGLPTNNPNMASAIAKRRGDEAKKLDVTKLLTCCPMCYMHLKNNNKDLQIIEFASVLKDAIE